jgi:asparagine synthase (glutamine-hydrolysing)
MCGIVGAVSASPVDRELLARMRDRLIHRGPDAAGLWSAESDRVCLGHRRLSIIDLSPEANQPLLSADGESAIVLNGEIYNFRPLRSELERAGAKFRTRSDTEVLLEAYGQWGADCLDRLSGMFAFAVWDASRKRLFCARDRAGEKPFYYAVLEDAFIFASELKALLLWPGFRRQLDHMAIADYLTFGFIPDPWTVWEGVRKFPPGHSLVVELSDSGPRVAEPAPYWDLLFEPDGSTDDWGPAIRSALEAAADEMSYADVPVGTFLSGGIDSSSVTAALAKAGHDVMTFTIGFEEADYDERPHAQEVADLFRTSHVQRTVVPADVDSVFRETILWHYDEPFADYSYLPTYYVCREARRAITVALTGDGGDELFGGYRKYTYLARRDAVQRVVPEALTQLIAVGARAVLPEGALQTRVARYEQTREDAVVDLLTTGAGPRKLATGARNAFSAAIGTYDPVERLRPHLVRAPVEEVGFVNAMRYLDFKLTLGSGILVKVDRASMAVSLETRPLYLNRAMLDVARRVPPDKLATGKQAKLVLRDALRPWLPGSIVDRPKMGFAMPLGRWLRSDLAGLAEARAGERPLDELLEPAYTASVVGEHLTGAADRAAELHSLIFLDHWLEKWW